MIRKEEVMEYFLSGFEVVRQFDHLLKRIYLRAMRRKRT